MGDAIYCGLITAGAIAETSGDTAYGRNADAREVVYFPIRQVLPQICHNLPAVNQRLKLGRCAQVVEELTQFAGIAQDHERFEEVFLSAMLLAVRFVSIGFHSCTNVLMR